jgi:cell division cycle 14
MRNPSALQRCVLIPGRLSFTAHDDDQHTLREIRANPALHFTSTELQESYEPFSSDFGPVNLGIVVLFCRNLNRLFATSQLQKREIVYYCRNDLQTIANTAFLLASYLVLEHEFTIDDATAPFELLPNIMIPFRDAGPGPNTFPLAVRDCVAGLKKAFDHGWLDVSSFDVDEYWSLDDPSNGDIHRICPAFIAFSYGSTSFPDNVSPTTWFETQARALRDLGVSRVVRLDNGPSSERTDQEMQPVFEQFGLRVGNLRYQDPVPSARTVNDFLEACKDDGTFGVCCSTGLGRTGTMIGVWLMVHSNFSAREAIAWMRIVRPGMVLGAQQHFLEDVERNLLSGTFASATAIAVG